MKNAFGLVLLVLVGAASTALGEEEPVFSGPQVGEKLPAMEARYVFGDAQGERFDPVAEAEGKPLLLVFVHEVTRPSIGLVRAVGEYAHARQADGLQTAVVFVASDATETEAMLKRARHALPKGVRVGISVDGREGPGAYGLDRNVALTVLVAKENKVTANFALVQPSMAVDAPRIGKALVDLVGGEPPKFDQGDMRGGMQREGVSDEEFRGLMAPLIRKEASPEDVEKAAQAIEEASKMDRALRERVGSVASRIVAAGRLEHYGTPEAQKYLEQWATQYNSANKVRPEGPSREDDKKSDAKQDEPKDDAKKDNGA